MFQMGPREERALRGTMSQQVSSKRKRENKMGIDCQETRRLKAQPEDPVPPREKKNSVGAVKVVRRKVRAERRNVVATFSVGDAPLGKRAQKGQLTQLERKSISNEQENQYHYYLTKFKDFCKANGLQWPPTTKIDLILADYFDILFQEGHGVSVGEKSLAAVEYHWHKVKGTLLRSRRALRGWRKAVPPKSRLPLPRVVAFAIAMRMLSLQLRAMALLVLVSFDVYLRPGEGLTLKVKNLVRPVRGSGKQFQNYVVVVRDEDDKVPDKTGVYNNSLPLDHPRATRWLGQALEKLKTGKRENDLLFNVDADKYRSLRSSRRLAGLARAAHLPAEAWRSCGRLAHQDSGVSRRCEGQREVANGRLCSEVRQSGQGADSVEQNAKVGSGLLPEVGSSDGGGAKGSQKPSQAVSPVVARLAACS